MPIKQTKQLQNLIKNKGVFPESKSNIVNRKREKFRKDTKNNEDAYKIGYGIADITSREVLLMKKDFSKYVLARKHKKIKDQKDQIMYNKAKLILKKMLNLETDDMDSIEAEAKLVNTMVGSSKYYETLEQDTIRVCCLKEVSKLKFDFKNKHFIEDDFQLYTELFKQTENINSGIIEHIKKEYSELLKKKKSTLLRLTNGQYKLLRVMNEYYEADTCGNLLFILLTYEANKKYYQFKATD